MILTVPLGTAYTDHLTRPRQLAASQQKLATTETALDIMGKAHALLEQISESADTEQPRKKR